MNNTALNDKDLLHRLFGDKPAIKAVTTAAVGTGIVANAPAVRNSLWWITKTAAGTNGLPVQKITGVQSPVYLKKIGIPADNIDGVVLEKKLRVRNPFKTVTTPGKEVGATTKFLNSATKNLNIASGGFAAGTLLDMITSKDKSNILQGDSIIEDIQRYNLGISKIVPEGYDTLPDEIKKDINMGYGYQGAMATPNLYSWLTNALNYNLLYKPQVKKFKESKAYIEDTIPAINSNYVRAHYLLPYRLDNNGHIVSKAKNIQGQDVDIIQVPVDSPIEGGQKRYVFFDSNNNQVDAQSIINTYRKLPVTVEQSPAVRVATVNTYTSSNTHKPVRNSVNVYSAVKSAPKQAVSSTATSNSTSSQSDFDEDTKNEIANSVWQ